MKKDLRFKKLKNGWILDTTTGKEWGKSSENRMNYKDAEAYCIKNGGLLPTRSELETIQDLMKFNPCVDKIFKDTKSSWYWSSTPTAFDKSARWCVSFNGGYVDGHYESCSYGVRPCRASQD